MYLRTLIILMICMLAASCRPGMLNSDPEAMNTHGEAIMPAENAAVAPRRAPLRVGDRVPPFALQDQFDRAVSAGELTTGKGSVLLFLAPDGAPANRPAWEWSRRNKNLLQRRGLELLLVTPETVARNNQIATREDAKLAILSDPRSWVARGFGIVPPKGPAPTQPWMFVLGNDSRIQFVDEKLPFATDLLIAAETMPGKEEDSFFLP